MGLPFGRLSVVQHRASRSSQLEQASGIFRHLRSRVLSHQPQDESMPAYTWKLVG
jgi:hypothetical protein